VITVITPTGDRPKAFDLCRQWMDAQTVPPDQWIIVDDGIYSEPFMDLGPGVDYIRRAPRPGDPKHTLGINLLAAVPHILGDKILFFEDDEYYAPNYIEVMAAHLDQWPAVGIGFSKYYHLRKPGYHKHTNIDHASLAQTAFIRDMLPVFVSKISGDAFIDVRFWKAVRHGGEIFDDDSTIGSLYCGIKGMPGRAGMGIGHLKMNDCYRQDPGWKVFRQWVHTPWPYLAIAEEMNVDLR